MTPSDNDIDHDMRRYYDAIAGDYERIYAAGDAGASLFGRDAAAVGALLPGLVGTRHLDLACGTGFWLRYCHAACGRVTLVDRSERMLDECRKTVAALRLGAKAELVRADLLALPFPVAGVFDSILIGFLLSHLAPAEEDRLFAGLGGILAPGGKIVLIDSAWNPERPALSGKSSIQTRTLHDGPSFSVRKSYLDEEELRAMGERHGVAWRLLYKGKAFLLAMGIFSSPASR